jgi:hypothetical protein
LPTSRLDLFNAILDPVLEHWRQQGQGDYAGLLFARAYEMLVSSEPAFETEHRSFPDGLLAPLLERRILIQRADQLQFQHHELVRAFLAAKHFAPRWRELLADTGLAISDRWLSMLEFAGPELVDPEQVKALLLKLLERFPARIARELFLRLKATDERLIGMWQQEFAAALLQRETVAETSSS